MKWINVRRTMARGFISFWRNGLVSFATVLVMVLTLFVLGALLFSNVMLTSALDQIQNKVDISVYFNTGADEEEILAIKSSLEKLGEVKAVEYISREEALRQFEERHKDNALIGQSLDELGENPLGASLNVKAKDPAQFESITRFLEAGAFEKVVDKINYRQNQAVIERLGSILSASRTLGAGITMALVGIAILVAFNTIRLAIYTSRDEISIMRLVGADNSFIRGPFLVEGVIHGVLASLAALLILWPLSAWLGPKAERFFGGPNLYDYYFSNFIFIFLMLLAVGVALGVISASIATRRYLKV